MSAPAPLTTPSALDPVLARIAALSDGTADTSRYATASVEEAVSQMWEGWEIRATGTYPKHAAFRPEPNAVVYQVFLLSHGPVWTALDVIVGEPAWFPEFAADTWEDLSAESRAYRVGPSALNRAFPVGLGPVELAHSMGTHFAGRHRLFADQWWAYCRAGDLLLRLTSDTVGDPDLAEQIAALHTLAGLGGFGGLLTWVERAGHRDDLIDIEEWSA